MTASFDSIPLRSPHFALFSSNFSARPIGIDPVFAHMRNIHHFPLIAMMSKRRNNWRSSLLNGCGVE